MDAASRLVEKAQQAAQRWSVWCGDSAARRDCVVLFNVDGLLLCGDVCGDVCGGWSDFFFSICRRAEALEALGIA